MNRLPLLGLCTLAACDPVAECLPVEIPALAVIVSDSVTNGAVLTGDILVVAMAGAYSAPVIPWKSS